MCACHHWVVVTGTINITDSQVAKAWTVAKYVAKQEATNKTASRTPQCSSNKEHKRLGPVWFKLQFFGLLRKS